VDVDNVECERPGTEFERLEEEAAREWYEHQDDEEVVFDDNDELSVVMTETSHSGDCEGKGKAPAVISVYKEMMEAAAKGDWTKKETKISTLVMRGDSERMQRYRRERERNLAKEAESMLGNHNLWFFQMTIPRNCEGKQRG